MQLNGILGPTFLLPACMIVPCFLDCNRILSPCYLCSGYPSTKSSETYNVVEVTYSLCVYAHVHDVKGAVCIIMYIAYGWCNVFVLWVQYVNDLMQWVMFLHV